MAYLEITQTHLTAEILLQITNSKTDLLIIKTKWTELDFKLIPTNLTISNNQNRVQLGLVIKKLRIKEQTLWMPLCFNKNIEIKRYQC